jgi:hypothetical protein
MLTNRTVTKKILETIVHETFSKFGVLASSSLLDSLKFLGFYYATNAGISINIEDLKTPNVKKQFIKIANDEINQVSKLWQQGFVSDSERFQTIIDSWNIATEALKNRIVDYYQTFDPANNLYIMAFSGARGNMSQVRQLVGMRGLMSDQEGKIIDLPIQANFREGLSSIDYIISSYGARKGIVDTALKTADSGYLTRRLIYLAQDLIIREENCKTNEGVIVILNKNTNIRDIVGRSLISTKALTPFSSTSFMTDVILTSTLLNNFKRKSPLILNVRSPLTCKANSSLCQNCYGWDLAQNRMISLGETVGIIAAQSIGEPGTQLTMRTFHTGGIFTSESLKQIVAPFSGKIEIPKTLNTISYRTNHGVIVLKLQQEARLSIVNWKGVQKELSLEIGSYLYIRNSSFVKKGQMISEYSTQASIPTTRRLKPIYTSFAGEIRFETLSVRKIIQERTKKIVKINQEDGVLWIASGKIFPLPKEVDYKFVKALNTNRSLAQLKVISPFRGIVSSTTSSISIVRLPYTIDYPNQCLKELTETEKKTITIDLFNLTKSFKNCKIKFFSTVKNYQYVDQHTVLGFLQIFPNLNGQIYAIRKKETKHITTYFFITESDVWKINSDQVNNFQFFQDKKTVVRSGNFLNTTAKFTSSGFFLKKDGFKMIFQNATPIFVTKGTILNYKQGDFVAEKKVFANLLTFSQQTEDIVQGLPKIEELIEARRPKIKASLAVRPGVFFNSYSQMEDKKRPKEIKTHLIEDTIHCSFNRKEEKKKNGKEPVKKKKDEKKIVLNILHSLFLKDEIIIYNNAVFKAHLVPSVFKPFLKPSKLKIIKNEDFLFKNQDNDNEFLCSSGKSKPSVWILDKVKNTLSTKKNSTLWKYKNGQLIEWETVLTEEKRSIFKNKENVNDLMVQVSTGNFLFLEHLTPISSYQLSLSSKILLKVGSFIDIGEPLTEGIIDIHELLGVLFHYHIVLDGLLLGTNRSLAKFQLLLVNSIQAIYQSQGVNISSKHIEIIVKQMTSKVVVKTSGDTPLLPGELIRLSLMKEISRGFDYGGTRYLAPQYEPVLLSATNSSLSKDGFLSAAGFQETKRVLTKAALEGSYDWLRGLKECIIIGRLIPAGSSFLNYKHYLDNIYLFKDLSSN